MKPTNFHTKFIVFIKTYKSGLKFVFVKIFHSFRPKNKILELHFKFRNRVILIDLKYQNYFDNFEQFLGTFVDAKNLKKKKKKKKKRNQVIWMFYFFVDISILLN